MKKLREGITKEEFEREFRNGTPLDSEDRLPPELLELHWALMTEQRKDIAAQVILGWKENFEWFPKYQAWLGTHRPPAVIVWGKRDGYMPEKSARGWLRDLLMRSCTFSMRDTGCWRRI